MTPVKPEMSDDELRGKISDLEIQLANRRFLLEATEKSIPEIKKEILLVELDLSDLEMTLKIRMTQPEEPPRLAGCEG